MSARAYLCVGVHNFVSVNKHMVTDHQIDANHNFARKRIHYFSIFSHQMHRRSSSWMRHSHEFLIELAKPFHHVYHRSQYISSMFARRGSRKARPRRRESPVYNRTSILHRGCCTTDYLSCGRKSFDRPLSPTSCPPCPEEH